MRKFLAGAALAASLAGGGPTFAADYTTIVLHIDVNRSADVVWAKVGGFCQIADWFNLDCKYTVGSGDVGTIRLLRGTTAELMVAKTRYSYSYTQPASTVLYHGTLNVEPVDSTHSQIVYTLLYDQESDATDDAKAKDRAMRTARFQTAIETMKKLAEAN